MKNFWRIITSEAAGVISAWLLTFFAFVPLIGILEGILVIAIAIAIATAVSALVYRVQRRENEAWPRRIWRWWRSRTKNFWRIITSETGVAVFSAWVLTLLAFVPLIGILGNILGVPVYDSSNSTIIGISLDRVALGVGAIATAVSALVYNVQRREDDAAEMRFREEMQRKDQLLREGMHREEQFRLWAEPLRDRTEGPATWEILTSLGIRDSALRQSVLRVAAHAIDQYLYDPCTQAGCDADRQSGTGAANGPPGERQARNEVGACDKHAMHMRLGSGPARCIAGVVGVARDEMGADPGSIAIGRSGAVALRDLDLGLLPAHSSHILDLHALTPGKETVLTLAVGPGAGERDIVLPQNVGAEATLICEVRGGASVVWAAPPGEGYVTIAGTVQLTVGDSHPSAVSTECILSGWVLTGTLELTVNRKAIVRFEDCQISGGVTLKNADIADAGIYSTYSKGMQPAPSRGVVTLQERLVIVNSCLDFSHPIHAPISRVVSLEATRESTVKLCFDRDATVGEVAVDSSSSVDLSVNGGLVVQKVSRLPDPGDYAAVVRERPPLVARVFSSSSSSSSSSLYDDVSTDPLLDDLSMEIHELVDQDVDVEFSSSARCVLKINKRAWDQLVGSVGVSSIESEGVVEVVTYGNDTDREKISPKGGTHLKWSHGE